MKSFDIIDELKNLKEVGVNSVLDGLSAEILELQRKQHLVGVAHSLEQLQLLIDSELLSKCGAEYIEVKNAEYSPATFNSMTCSLLDKNKIKLQNAEADKLQYYLNEKFSLFLLEPHVSNENDFPNNMCILFKIDKNLTTNIKKLVLLDDLVPIFNYSILASNTAYKHEVKTKSMKI